MCEDWTEGFACATCYAGGRGGVACTFFGATNLSPVVTLFDFFEGPWTSLISIDAFLFADDKMSVPKVIILIGVVVVVLVCKCPFNGFC